MAPLMANSGRKFPAGVTGKPARKGRGTSLACSCCYYLVVTLIGFSFVLYWYTKAGPGVGPEHEELEEEDELKGCPVCTKSDAAKTPLDRALSDWGSKVKLCTGSESGPFVTGTYAVDPHGVETETAFAQLTVFEVEVHHRAATNSSGVLKSLVGATRRGGPHTTSLRILAFLEDDDSIKRTQWEGWGAAEPSDLYWKHFHLKCLIWPGHDRSIQSLPAAYEVDAVIEHYYSFHMVVTCPLPPYPPPGQAGRKRTQKDGRAYFVQYGQKFHIQLVPRKEQGGLRMNPVPICRAEYEPALLQLDPSNVAPPVSSGTTKHGIDDPSLTGSVKGISSPKPMQVAICLRPFHSKQLFSNEIAFTDARLVEWIEAALMVGVDRVYFYDRYGTEKKALLKPYIMRGQVIHVPFPPWSEVHVRKDQYAGKARVPYLFPAIYDQILSYEHCLMQGRRMGDKWQFHIDSDEFLWYDPRKGALLKPLLARIEANHTKSLNEPLKVIKLRRYNFFGVEEENRGDPVLGRLGWRCSQPMWHTEGWVGWHDKLGVNPQLIVPNTVTIHNTNAPATQVTEVPKEAFHINHYTSTGVDLGHHPCRAWVKPVKDEGLLWIALKVWRCKQLACSRKIPVECWPFCQLPWPAAHEDHKGEPEQEVDLSAILAANGTNYPAEGATESPPAGSQANQTGQATSS